MCPAALGQRQAVAPPRQHCQGFLQLQAGSSRPIRHHRHTRHGLRTCATAAKERASSQAQQPGDDCEADLYPRENNEEEGGFFPVRDPGEFPKVAVRGPLRRLASKAADKLSSMTGIDLSTQAAAVPDAPPQMEAEEKIEAAQFDPLRDGPLRYLGYANECGEAFAAWIPPFGVPLSYGIAISYVLVDTIDKGAKAFQAANIELGANGELHPEVNRGRLSKLLSFERALDTIVWQLLASVICPGYTIHTVVALVHAGLVPLEAQESVKHVFESLAPTVSMSPDVLLTTVDKSVPTAAGLAAIPFIVHPIDNAIHALLNLSMRPAMRKYICGQGQGALADLAICDDECKVPET